MNLGEEDVLKESSSTCSSRSLTAGHDVCHGPSRTVVVTCFTPVKQLAGPRPISQANNWLVLLSFIIYYVLLPQRNSTISHEVLCFLSFAMVVVLL